jgi:cytochrome c-type biogenesis protein CcmF
MEFTGEHLLPGQIGHFFIILSFVAATLAAISYFSSLRGLELNRKRWLQMGRASLTIQFSSLIVVFLTLVYICSLHYFEYMYVYKHASRELELKYLLACIWEGQEGSFLLWSIWQGLMGLIIIRKGKEWEAPVNGIISVAQLCFSMMILGIYLGDIRIGNNPFVLTRDEIAAPIFNRPDYLQFIKDGVGLNVLLRNYWMVIHPPVLFLGFASSLVPFAYAVSALFKKPYQDSWIKPILPWALFCGGVLGVGIMMGGKWAYESLSFGGYWAWDPVENASLVPWLILIAGIHTVLIYKATGHSLRSTFLFFILTYAFVLYSTFLTRTGILGDTSVHAFTEAGAAINFMIGMMVTIFTVLPLILLILRGKELPSIRKEEATGSREFWMFMGSLVLFLSALFIIIITSIPVFNKTPLLNELIIKIHGGSLALPEDPEFLYNKVMIMVSIFIGLMSATGQYFKYKQTETAYFLRKIGIPTLLAMVLSAILLFLYPLNYLKHGIGFLIAIYTGYVCMIFAFISNAGYIWMVLKGNMKLAGGSVSHAGFALMITGIIISSANKQVISDSKVNGINLAAGTDPMTRKTDDPKENLTLIRQVPTTMGDYTVTFTGDSSGHEKGRKFYSLLFENKLNTSEKPFALKPDVYLMKDNNMSSNPDIKSYITKDIFTYVSFALNEKGEEDTTQFRIVELGEGDTIFYSNGLIKLMSVMKNPNNGRFQYGANDMALVADLKIVTKDNKEYQAFPAIEVDSLGILQRDDTVYAQNMFLKFSGVTQDRKIKLGIKESDKFIDFVTVKTYMFPYINLVWLGLILLAIGFCISMLNRAGIRGTKALICLLLVTAGVFYMFLIANS